jgi:hypothetical protein
MLAGLAKGETDSAVLAQHARGRMQRKRQELESALSGRMGPHQQFLLQEQLALVSSLDASIQRVNDEIARRSQPHSELLERLDEIPGLGPRIILAEIRPDLTRFHQQRIWLRVLDCARQSRERRPPADWSDA